MQSKGRLNIFRRPFLMPAYFHFSNSPPRLTAIRTEYPSLPIHPYPTPRPSSNELNPFRPATAALPVFPIFQTTPMPFRKQGRLKPKTNKTQTTKNRPSKRGRF